ncbi:MAG: hypothetical protein ACE5G3_05695 [Gammaproteobacteria bacterium]
MAEAEDVRLTEHQRSWLERIRACEASGMTVSAYAAEHGLNARTMYGARKVLKRKGVLPGGAQGIGFQRARIVVADSRDMSWRIALPNGVTVSFSGAVDTDSLSMVLHTVAHLG